MDSVPVGKRRNIRRNIKKEEQQKEIFNLSNNPVFTLKRKETAAD